MARAKLTSKGQITIPKEVRESLRLRVGDVVAFEVLGDAEAVLRPVTKSVDEVFGTLHRPGRPSRSVEEMKAAVAEKLRRGRR